LSESDSLDDDDERDDEELDDEEEGGNDDIFRNISNYEPDQDFVTNFKIFVVKNKNKEDFTDLYCELMIHSILRYVQKIIKSLSVNHKK
jgi:hypothetical protein